MRDCTLSTETYRESASEGKKNVRAGSLRYKAYQINWRIQDSEMNKAAIWWRVSDDDQKEISLNILI